jgi:hypothetical protein
MKKIFCLIGTNAEDRKKSPLLDFGCHAAAIRNNEILVTKDKRREHHPGAQEYYDLLEELS